MFEGDCPKINFWGKGCFLSVAQVSVARGGLRDVAIRYIPKGKKWWGVHRGKVKGGGVYKEKGRVEERE